MWRRLHAAAAERCLAARSTMEQTILIDLRGWGQISSNVRGAAGARWPPSWPRCPAGVLRCAGVLAGAEGWICLRAGARWPERERTKEQETRGSKRGEEVAREDKERESVPSPEN